MLTNTNHASYVVPSSHLWIMHVNTGDISFTLIPNGLGFLLSFFLIRLLGGLM